MSDEDRFTFNAYATVERYRPTVWKPLNALASVYLRHFHKVDVNVAEVLETLPSALGTVTEALGSSDHDRLDAIMDAKTRDSAVAAWATLSVAQRRYQANLEEAHRLILFRPKLLVNVGGERHRVRLDVELVEWFDSAVWGDGGGAEEELERDEDLRGTFLNSQSKRIMKSFMKQAGRTSLTLERDVRGAGGGNWMFTGLGGWPQSPPRSTMNGSVWS